MVREAMSTAWDGVCPDLLLLADREDMISICDVSQFLGNDAAIDRFALLTLPAWIKERAAIAMCSVNNAYAASADSGTRPSQSPDRQEVVMISAIAADNERHLMARKLRMPDGSCKLLHFVDLVRENGKSPIFHGPIIEAARTVLRELNADAGRDNPSENIPASDQDTRTTATSLKKRGGAK